jgi:predicted membrane-bound spermidine synthase
VTTADQVITPRALMVLVAVEGFTSLAYEVIALRRIVPYVGSSITVTAPTIAIFLAALAIGYFAASRVTADFKQRVLRNFIAAAAVGGVMLSSWGAAIVFGLIPNASVALAVYLLLAMAPPAYFLAQTVPVLANVVGRAGAGEASGVTLAASTAGSVLGALTLSLVVMQTLGVRAALLLTSLALLLSAAWFARRLGQRAVVAQAMTAIVPVIAMNFLPAMSLRESAYADYQVVTIPKDGQHAQQLLVNRQVASELRDAGRRADYVEYLAGELKRTFGATERRILVLGAGGFTLSLSDDRHQYTYVDIDPAIKDLVESHFLRHKIRGRFVVDDARSFVVSSSDVFDAIVVDVYSSHVSIPSHLTTREFWLSLRPRLAEKGGVVLVNLVLEPSLTSAYSRNLLATIRSALGECAIAVLAPAEPISNVELTCRAGLADRPAARIYTDDLNSVDRDRNVRGH